MKSPSADTACPSPVQDRWRRGRLLPRALLLTAYFTLSSWNPYTAVKLRAQSNVATNVVNLPTLVIQPVDNRNVRLVWPASALGFDLQQASTLLRPVPWQLSPLARASNGGTISVTAPLAQAQEYFRLVETNSSPTNPPPLTASNVTLTLGAPQQLLQPLQLGMTDVPDMHTAMMRQADGRYRLWISGRFENDKVEGATGLLLTRDFLTFTAGAGSTTTVLPVLVPSCRNATAGPNCDKF